MEPRNKIFKNLIMFEFKLNLIAGTIFAKIKSDLEQIESLYLGLFISDLRYKDEKEGKNKKNDFYNKLREVIKKTNHEIKKFNFIIKKLDKSLAPLKIIDLVQIKKIIENHKGDYAQGAFLKEIFGEGDSPSVLSRKHTALLIRNILWMTHLSMTKFLESLEIWLAPFNSIDNEKIRKITKKELDKIKAIYSIGCLGEAIFMVGRLLENIITEYLLLLKKNKATDLKINYIKSVDFSFENKIDFLHGKKQKILSNSQWSKMKSIKWDRNTYGHYNRIKPKDAGAIITIGLQNIEFIDKKIQKLKKNK